MKKLSDNQISLNLMEASIALQAIEKVLDNYPAGWGTDLRVHALREKLERFIETECPKEKEIRKRLQKEKEDLMRQVRAAVSHGA